MPDEPDVHLKALREKIATAGLKVWLTPDDETHAALDMPPILDPAAWGVVLADLAGHIANIYHVEKGADKRATVQRIAAGFNAEVESPTEPAAGHKT